MPSDVINTLSQRAQNLRQRLSVQEKCALAADMGDTLDSDGMSEQERTLALAIIEILIRDEVSQVRRAISNAVAQSVHLPLKLAEQLANDINDVAIPVLKLSPVLTDEFIETIINSGIMDKLNAIAERTHVSSNVCRRLIATGQNHTVIKLLNNPGADISTPSLVTIIRVYARHNDVEEALLNRGSLPGEVLNSLKLLAEAHVSSFIRRYFNLPEHVIEVRTHEAQLQQQQKAESLESWWDPKQGVQ